MWNLAAHQSNALDFDRSAKGRRGYPGSGTCQNEVILMGRRPQGLPYA